jgi:hypothetical protein
LVKSTNYKAPHFAAFSNLLYFHFSLVQMFSSTPCSLTLSACDQNRVYFIQQAQISQLREAAHRFNTQHENSDTRSLACFRQL